MFQKKLKKSIFIIVGAFCALYVLGKKKKMNEGYSLDQDNQYLHESPDEAEKNYEANKNSGFYEAKGKRLIDITLSFMGLVLLAPVFVIIAVLILIDDPGSVFFSQKRIGKDKHFFMLHKFRTMKMSTPHDVPTHMLDNPDQYITRVGQFLRKSSLDELPQVWDIFVGNMSIIGPRPALWNQDDLVKERDKYGANDILPGLTGWAQVNGRDELEIPIKARLDGEYVEKLRSGSGFYFDLKCFFKTITSVLRSDGVVEGGTGEINKKNAPKDNSGRISILAENPLKKRNPARRKKIVIVGKGSYIGTKVRDYLNGFSDYYEVDELDVLTDKWKEFDFSPYDVVFQVAGIAHQRETKDNAHLYYEVNRDLTLEVAKKAKAAGVEQYIYMSTMSVYGLNVSKADIDLETEERPNTNYGKSKLQAERLLSELVDDHFKTAYVRPPMVYGEGAPGNLEKLFRAVRKVHMFPDICNERSAISVNNLCEAVKTIIDAETSGIVIPQDPAYHCTTNDVKERMEREGVKVVYTKLFNPVIRLLIGRVDLISKVFGDLKYSMDLGCEK